jgi:hypothetical protein
MKQTDKFLFAIVAGIVILVVAAFAFVLLSPEPQYRTDDTPEAAVQNYLLALQQEEYERALDEISLDVPHRPLDGSGMEWDISQNSWQFERYGDPSLVISRSRISGDHATVTLAETRSYGIFPGDVSSQDVVMRLKQDDSGWKLIGGNAYWVDDWDGKGKE